MQPPHPKEGEVLVKVYATGVTLNEIVWIWEHPGISLPLILGHEFSGLVEEVGPKVTNQRKANWLVKQHERIASVIGVHLEGKL